MKKNVFLLALAVCLTVSHTYAQKPSDDSSIKPYALAQKKFAITVQPLQLFNWCLRHDIDVRLGDSHNWLQFGLAVYYRPMKDNDNYYYEGNEYYNRYYWDSGWFRDPLSELKGYGLEINYKRFVDARRSFYFAAGLSYSRLDVKYRGWVWKDYIEDGLQYFKYIQDFDTQKITRQGVNISFGYQIPTRRLFLCDLFWGFAYRHSYLADKDKPAFDRDMFSFGYTGIVFQTGVRIGFGLK
jgi:hypothetical protein